MTELDVSNLLTMAQATGILDATIVQPKVVRLPLSQCLGRILALDVLCDRDVPPFKKSLMDGWAVRSGDVANVPCELAVAGRIAAGEQAAHKLSAGETMAIMTGAPLPAGADAVVPVEHTESIVNGARVRFTRAAKAQQFIAHQGSDAAAGAVVLNHGMRVSAAQVAVAATVGAAELDVYAPPSIGVLGTGDELVAIDATPVGAQIRSCNNPMLVALLAQLGYAASDLGVARDDPAAIHQAIESGLRHDVLLVSGGISMGERDFVPKILHELGGQLKITKLRIKPGKPFIFAEMPRGKFAFGLPGNPVSAFVCTATLVRRLLDRISGAAPAQSTRVAPLAKDLEPNGPRQFYQPAIFDGRAIEPLAWKGSGDIFTLARANALVVRAENQGAMKAGMGMEFWEI